MSTWYEKCMPKVKDIKPNISNAVNDLKKTTGVKSVYLWGSYANNINKPNYRVRDIDILARTKFYSEDLISVDNKTVDGICTNNYLENQGYDPLAVKFSKKFLDLTKYNVDCWAISSDRKLLHWGPIFINKKESEEINKEASKHAENLTGKNRKNINKSSECMRKNWYNHYCKYIDKCFEGMPTGWYRTEDIKIKEILSDTIKV